MSNKIKIICLTVLLMVFISPIVLAEVEVENKIISVDLSPTEIKDSTYLPLLELADKGFFDLDKIDEKRYFVLTGDAYYSLESGKKNVKSNANNIVLDNPPLYINGHFLVPVEFLRQRLDLRLRALNRNTERSVDLPQPENMRLRVYLDDDEYDRYDDLELRIEIMNTDNKAVNLRFNSAQKYNIYLKNRFGRVLYSWAEGKIFSQAVQNIEIEGRDSLSFSEEISLRQFDEGSYRIEVEIVAANYGFDKVVKEFEIDD